MLETLISSKTRIKLLIKFYLNPDSSSYLRSLESEFNESTNSIRLELNRFEKVGMLMSVFEGNRKVFRANVEHPLFNEIRGIILKYTGVDTIVQNVIKRLGNLDRVYLTGDLAKGKSSDIIDLIFIGQPDRDYLLKLLDKAEKITKRKVRYLIYNKQDEIVSELGNSEDYLLLWYSEK